MMTYTEWRKKYVRQWEGKLYVAYNEDGASHPKEAITVSEATGYSPGAVHSCHLYHLCKRLARRLACNTARKDTRSSQVSISPRLLSNLNSPSILQAGLAQFIIVFIRDDAIRLVSGCKEPTRSYTRRLESQRLIRLGQPRRSMACLCLCRWGLLIAVLAEQHTDFKGFLLFYEQFLNQKGLMSWQLCRTSGPVYVNLENGGCNAATDGVLDAAYALLLAGRWLLAAVCSYSHDRST